MLDSPDGSRYNEPTPARGAGRGRVGGVSTCGDIFPDPLDGDGGIFDPITVHVLHHPLYPSVDLHGDDRGGGPGG